MPLYEYRCRICDERFEQRRPQGDADAPVACPAGHEGAVRLLAAFAATGRTAAAPAAPCGGACACAG